MHNYIIYLQVVTKRILGKKNFECLLASSGEEAIEVVKEEHLDEVLIDVNMPNERKRVTDFPFFTQYPPFEQKFKNRFTTKEQNGFLKNFFDCKFLFDHLKATLDK